MRFNYRSQLLYLGTLLLLGLITLWVPTGRVAADMSAASSTMDFMFGCSDGSRDSTVTANKTPPKTITVSCKAYKTALVDYLNYTSEDYTVKLSIACPSGQNVSLQPSPSADAAQSVTFSCLKVIGHDANGLPTYAKGSASTPKSSAPAVTTNSSTPSQGSFTQAGLDGSSLPQASPDSSTIHHILNLVFGILGAIAVLMVTIGGLRYILANGDSNKVAQAKNTIIYALVGLVIVITAFSIVTFVIKGLS